MIPALTRFARLLRREGIAASPAELLDAARALEAVGLEDRARFRAALRATLAKSRSAVDAFDRAFEAFFVPPARAPRDGAGGRPGAGEGGERRAAPSGSGAAKPPSRRPDDLDDEKRGRRGTAEDRDAVRRALAAARLRVERRQGRLRRAPEKRQVPRPGPVSARPSRDPLRRTLAQAMTLDDERALAREVPRLIEALRLREARRMKRARRGELALRDVFRRNVSRGGVPFELPYRRPRRRPARVVLLVDVSWSVARAAGFFLWMAGAFLAPGRRSRIVAFVDRPVDATAAIARWARSRGGVMPEGARAARRRRPGEGLERGGVSFAQVLDGLEGLALDAPSDYGRALHGLLKSRLAPAGRDTVLVVLGDARTNRFDPLPWALEEIARRCRAVIWLVPEPESRWGTADSALAAYLPAVDLVAEATDLAGLAGGLARVLRRL